jgi:type II secretory pathway component GspD/PulD (secretin)
MRKLLVITFLFAAGSLAAVAQQPSSTHPHASPRHKVRHSTPNAAPATAQPAPAAVVSYQNGLLTVTAENAKLRDVLDRIHDSTGAVIDGPTLNQRVTVHLGPQPPAQVISALLAGAHVNYVIMGDTADSRAVRTILVMPATAAGPEPAPPPPAVDADADAAATAKTKALVTAQTGGDEGVWDNVDVGTPVVPTSPAATQTVPTLPVSSPASSPAESPAQSRPAPGTTPSAPIVPQKQQ